MARQSELESALWWSACGCGAVPAQSKGVPSVGVGNSVYYACFPQRACYSAHKHVLT